MVCAAQLKAGEAVEQLLARRRSAAAIVPPTEPTRLVGAVPCEKGALVTGFVLALGTHQTHEKVQACYARRQLVNLQHEESFPKAKPRETEC